MAELTQIPSDEELRQLIGADNFTAWKRISAAVDSRYDMDRQWNDGGKKWRYEYKYRRGGKTLCALYARQECFGFMIIFGKGEREKIEAIRDRLAANTLAAYDSATVYHDGKWVMFDTKTPLEDLKTLLAIKRKPNRK